VANISSLSKTLTNQRRDGGGSFGRREKTAGWIDTIKDLRAFPSRSNLAPSIRRLGREC